MLLQCLLLCVAENECCERGGGAEVRKMSDWLRAHRATVTSHQKEPTH